MDFIKWCDDHSGFISVVLFVLTLFIGWIVGFFKYIRQKPKFKIHLLAGPSFVCVIPDHSKLGEYSTHRIVISLYLSVTNVGSSAGAITEILAAYEFPPTGKKSIFKMFKSNWYSLKQTAALEDFCYNMGDHLKVYPFLSQRSLVLDTNGSTYCRVGETLTGIVYYENPNLAWGSHKPVLSKGIARVKLNIQDSLGGKHNAVVSVPELSIEEARKFSKAIGKTYSNLQNSKIEG